MFDLHIYMLGGMSLLLLAVILWLISLIKNDVSIVDSFWSLMILLAGVIFFIAVPDHVERSYLVLGLAVIWALRLALHIGWRNWGEGEDLRYQTIRANNQPYFNFKSLYIVFGLQAVLAWLVSLPLLAAINSQGGLYWLDYLALSLWIIGMLFEVVGDYQLAQFKANPANKGQVMAQGLWRYTRHPNYFGEFCIWWGFFVFALAAGGGWSIVSPLLMSVLLLKVSGVALLEKDISHRRPGYSQYIQTTNAFFPWWPKAAKTPEHTMESET